MSTVEITREQTGAATGIPFLEAGDHLDRSTFHDRYEAMPPGVKAELIGGIVFMPSPAKVPHGRHTAGIVYWLGLYEERTPGVESLGNTTVVLAEDSEPQPDAALRILVSYGGQSRENEEDYLVGAPELVIEIASSSVSYDLHSKRHDYEKYGVKEYVVIVVRQQAIPWFVRDDKQLVEQQPDSDGLFRSHVFGGLWFDSRALFDRNLRRLREVVEMGLASAEHAEFIKRLEDAAGK